MLQVCWNIVQPPKSLMFRFFHELWQNRLFKKALDEPSTGEACVACEGLDLTSLAPAAYGCNAYGHEGGDGLSAFYRIQQRLKIDALAPEERRVQARGDLIEVRRVFLAVRGTLESAHG